MDQEADFQENFQTVLIITESYTNAENELPIKISSRRGREEADKLVREDANKKISCHIGIRIQEVKTMEKSAYRVRWLSEIYTSDVRQQLQKLSI